MKKLLLILFCLPMIGFGQDVFYGKKLKKMEKIIFGKEIKANYFSVFTINEKQKWIEQSSGFCESFFLPVDENYYYFKFNDCLNKIDRTLSELYFKSPINESYRIFWQYSKELSSKDIDVYQVEFNKDGDKAIVIFNYKNQTISLEFNSYRFTISKLEIE